MIKFLFYRVLGSFGASGLPPPTESVDVCLDASTDHGRTCDGVGCGALNQTVQIPPGGVQGWKFTLPAAQVPNPNIDGWTIVVGFSPTVNRVASHTETATITGIGVPNVTAAEFTITLDADDLTGFTYDSFWKWSCWRTNSGDQELLAGGALLGMSCVTLP